MSTKKCTSNLQDLTSSRVMRGTKLRTAKKGKTQTTLIQPFNVAYFYTTIHTLLPVAFFQPISRRELANSLYDPACTNQVDTERYEMTEYQSSVYKLQLNLLQLLSDHYGNEQQRRGDMYQPVELNTVQQVQYQIAALV